VQLMLKRHLAAAILAWVCCSWLARPMSILRLPPYDRPTAWSRRSSITGGRTTTDDTGSMDVRTTSDAPASMVARATTKDHGSTVGSGAIMAGGAITANHVLAVNGSVAGGRAAPAWRHRRLQALPNRVTLKCQQQQREL